MPTQSDILQLIGIIAAVIAMIVVVQWRRRSQRQFMDTYAEQEVCEHLKEPLHLLKSRGHYIVRAGQQRPDMPLEIHIAPPFSPQSIADELKLKDPVYVSDRNVLYCEQDWCELRPAGA